MNGAVRYIVIFSISKELYVFFKKNDEHVFLSNTKHYLPTSS